MSTLSPEERSARARKAAHAYWSRKSREEASREARERQLKKYEREVDPDGTLDPVERRARAKNAAAAHMADLSLRAAKARRLRAEAAALDAEVCDAGKAS